MKRTQLFVSLLALFVLTTGIVNCQTKETRDVRGFKSVNFGVAGDLFINIGPEYSVVIEGDRDVLRNIETNVSGNKLSIRRDNWHFSFNDEKVSVHITMPEIEGVGVSGSGKVQIMDPVKADRLDFSVSGSGKLYTASLEADRLDCGISGSGDIILGSGGSIDNGEVSISGSGKFSGEQTEIDKLEVSISGSGDCFCKAGDSLDARVSGSGNVTYYGNPKVNARVSGSGHVRSR